MHVYCLCMCIRSRSATTPRKAQAQPPRHGTNRLGRHKSRITSITIYGVRGLVPKGACKLNVLPGSVVWSSVADHVADYYSNPTNLLNSPRNNIINHDVIQDDQPRTQESQKSREANGHMNNTTRVNSVSDRNLGASACFLPVPSKRAD